MKNILILGAKGDLAKSLYKNIDKGNNKIYKLEKKDINFLNLNSQKKLFLFLKKINPDVIINCIGYFDTNNYWLLDNQIYNGQVGYDLLALLKLSDESRFLLVNLGWVKAERSREILPNVTIPSGKFTLTAQIKEDNLSGFTLANNNTQSDLAKRIQIIDLQALSSQSQRPLVDYMAYRQGGEDEIAAPHYEAVVMSPEKHYAYSVQWFLIAIACVVVAIFASKKRIDNEK